MPGPGPGWRQHYPDLPSRPRLVAVADTRRRAAGRRPVRTGSPSCTPTGASCWPATTSTWSALRPERPPPRHGGGRGRGREAPVDREAGGPQRRRDRGRSRTPWEAGVRPRPASTTATRQRSSGPGELVARRPAGQAARHVGCGCSPTTPRTRGRADLAVNERAGSGRARVTSLATASTCALPRRRDQRLVADDGGVHRRPAAGGGRGPLRPRRRRHLGAVENEDYVSALLRFPAARGGRWRRAGSRWASRTPTRSRSTATVGRWPGTSGGWASCGSSIGTDYQDARTRHVLAARGTASSARSSPAPASRWATTTSR